MYMTFICYNTKALNNPVDTLSLALWPGQTMREESLPVGSCYISVRGKQYEDTL